MAVNVILVVAAGFFVGFFLQANRFLAEDFYAASAMTLKTNELAERILFPSQCEAACKRFYQLIIVVLMQVSFTLTSGVPLSLLPEMLDDFVFVCVPFLAFENGCGGKMCFFRLMR